MVNRRKWQEKFLREKGPDNMTGLVVLLRHRGALLLGCRVHPEIKSCPMTRPLLFLALILAELK
jgi:hypothetical protein